jgi:RNA polymerase sigma-70 factor (ECF subfamily)
MLDAPWQDEAALLAQLRRGEEAAFVVLVDALDGRLRRLARLFVADAGAAAEVVQDTWLAVITGLAGFEGRSSLRTWITRICVNKAKTRGVRDARSVPLASARPGSDEGRGEGPTVDAARFAADGHWRLPPARFTVEGPEGAVLRAEEQRLLAAALETLPARQRQVVTLRDVEGLAAEDVCNALDLSESNQRVLLHRARAALRAAVERIVMERRKPPGQR